jgi:hypothetical protein
MFLCGYKMYNVQGTMSNATTSRILQIGLLARPSPQGEGARRAGEVMVYNVRGAMNKEITP